MNVEKNVLSLFKGLSDDEKRDVLNKQTEQRIRRPEKNVQDLTNAEIAELDDFKKFCELNEVEPSKRQASKSKDAFIKWHDENK